MKKIIIVESPAKAKTIKNYLNQDFLVLSSKGHIRDLSKSGKDGLGINITNNFKPSYKIISNKKKIVQDIIQLSKGKEVFLATDPDREGEAIAWHLSQILKLDLSLFNRIIFREMTKKNIIYSVDKPRPINYLLVSSQETRRMLDRIIGFKLTKLVKRLNSQSAGRVQSVALKLIVDLELQREQFIPEEYYLIKAIFDNFQLDLLIDDKKKIKLDESKKILDTLQKKPFIVKEIIKKKVIKKPHNSFITSTLQQEAFHKLNMNSAITMLTAQKLYEGSIKINGQPTGLITYMRTDSYRMSATFIEETKTYIKNVYGSNYVGDYKEKNKSNSQDAHEAIRPTDINQNPEILKQYLNNNEYKLYKLIYQRTLASLMSVSIFEKTQVIFTSCEYKFVIEGLIRNFDGYQKILEINNKDQLLPHFNIDDVYYPQDIISNQCFTVPPTRFSEATLIKTLEKLNIGRPSTYSKIIKILKDRHYIVVEDKRFVPTEQGILTKNILEKFFSDIVNVDYTSQIENKLDQIALGQIDFKNVLRDFYNDFESLYEQADQKIVKEPPKITDKKCQLCNHFLVVRKGKYGEFLGCSNFPNCKYLESLSKNKKPINLTDQKCQLCNHFLVVRKGKYGEFLGCSNFPNCNNIINLKKEKK